MAMCMTDHGLFLDASLPCYVQCVLVEEWYHTDGIFQPPSPKANGIHPRIANKACFFPDASTHVHLKPIRFAQRISFI